MVKAVRPRKSPDYRKYINEELEKALDEEAGIVLRMFQRTTKTWKHRPKFYTRVSRPPYKDLGGAQDVKIIVGTTDEIYGYVNHGTKGPYKIPKTPKTGKDFLIFTWGGKPKTKHRVIGSTAGTPGTKWAKKRQVTHPGIEAREFDLEIAKRRRKQWYKKMQAAIDRGAARAKREAGRSQAK
jgi:hypothetical protein